MRRFVGYILFLATIATASAQTSAWWYPLGPPEATRRQAAPTNNDSIPVIRWRTSSLRSSPVVLVGALRDASGAQQILGQNGDTIVVLQSAGWRDTAVSNVSLALPAESTIRLTGLFNTLAPTPEASGAANTIGVGVTRAQQVRNLFGLLLKPDFTLRQELEIQRLTSSRPENRIASVHPIATYTPPGEPAPIAVALISQDLFVPGDRDTMINGIRRYSIDESQQKVTPVWRYVVAPRTLDNPSAMMVDSSSGEFLLAMSTSAYTFSPAVTATQIRPPSGAAVETSSSRAYAYLGNAREPTIWEEIEIPPIPPSIVVPGVVPTDATSYFVRLHAQGREQPFRLIAEEHDRERPGNPRLLIRRYNVRLPDNQNDAIFADTTVRDLGWVIVQADLDGIDRSRGPDWLPQSPGLELLAMRRRLDGGALDTNRLFVFRGLLVRWADQRLRGTLLAAGDLVRDSLEKDEIVIADGSSVSILRLRAFDDPRLREEVPSFFDTLRTFHLDARIVSGAIADVEGDGANDLVVVTEAGTYVIGRSHPAPLGVLAPDRTELCANEPVVFSWRRAVSGGELGMRVELLRIDVADTTLLEESLPASSGESYTMRATGLAPGRYRLRISDRDVPSIAAESAEILILTPSIESFSVAAANVGEPVRIATTVRCVDSVALEYSFPGTPWVRVPGRIAVTDNLAEVASFPMPCPVDLPCGVSEDRVVQFRFVTTDGATVSPPASTSVRFPARSVDALPVSGAGTRRRELRWHESDYSCDSVRIALSSDDGSTWTELATVARSLGRLEIEVPGELSQEMLARICCDVGCGTGLARFAVEEIGEADFIAPNPYDPSGEDGLTEASIIYRLTRPGAVTITIYDAARAVVRQLLLAEELRSGLHRATWNGRTDTGEIVADGTYICLITSSSGDRIALPLSVVKR